MSGRRKPRGFFTIGVYHPKTEANIGTLWRAAYLYGASSIFTIGRRYKPQASDTPKTPGSIPLYHYSDMDDAVAHLPSGSPLIGVELAPEAIALSDLLHPARATYLLGAEDAGLPKAVLDMCHAVVQIESVEAASHNVSAAGSILMYHRHIQALNGPEPRKPRARGVLASFPHGDPA